MKDKLRIEVLELVQKKVSNSAFATEAALMKVIESEKFLDKLVDRIKRKQLS